MRHFVTRTLSLLLMFFVFVLPVSFFGQNQKSKKPAPHSSKAVAEKTFEADEGRLVRVETPIRNESRGPSTGGRQDQLGAKPLEPPIFRLVATPTVARLMPGKPFH